VLDEWGLQAFVDFKCTDIFMQIEHPLWVAVKPDITLLWRLEQLALCQIGFYMNYE